MTAETPPTGWRHGDTRAIVIVTGSTHTPNTGTPVGKRMATTGTSRCCAPHLPMATRTSP